MSHWFTPPSQFYGDCWWLCSEDGELCWWSCREDGELCWWLHSEDGELMPHWFTCPSVQSFVENAGDYAVRMVNNLLDMLTKGQHSRTNRTLEQVSHTHIHLFFFIVSFFFISFSSSFFFCLVSPFNILKTDAFSACWVIQWFHNPPNSDSVSYTHLTLPTRSTV